MMPNVVSDISVSSCVCVCVSSFLLTICINDTTTTKLFIQYFCLLSMQSVRVRLKKSANASRCNIKLQRGEQIEALTVECNQQLAFVCRRRPALFYARSLLFSYTSNTMFSLNKNKKAILHI